MTNPNLVELSEEFWQKDNSEIREIMYAKIPNFARRRIVSGYTQHELARKAELISAFVCQLESGKRSTGPDAANRQNQQKLTPDQKAFLQRLELAIREMPIESYIKVEQALSSVLALVETTNNSLKTATPLLSGTGGK